MKRIRQISIVDFVLEDDLADDLMSTLVSSMGEIKKQIESTSAEVNRDYVTVTTDFQIEIKEVEE